jgi:hypothetical protein
LIAPPLKFATRIDRAIGSVWLLRSLSAELVSQWEPEISGVVGVQARFSAGDRIRVSNSFFWAKGASGTVSAPPDAVTAMSGAWDRGLTRRETSALGTNTVYWVWFDEPQHDADGDGPYRGGQIWESALTLLSTGPN